ncbi:MAG: Spy/CpxP family protein refolding chaperone [Halioglobus sp.]|nr:Spy/CpxP family protein refolding chaperone [Halioglobus sp.]
MNKTAKRTLLAAVAAGAVTVGFAASSWSKPPFAERHGLDPERFAERMAARLDLSGQQEDAVMDILSGNADRARDNRQRMRELKRELADLRSDFDSARAEALAGEVGAVAADMALARATTGAEIYQLLDEEQRARFEELQEQRRKHRAWRHGPGF